MLWRKNPFAESENRMGPSGVFAVEITSPETHGGQLFQPYKGTSFWRHLQVQGTDGSAKPQKGPKRPVRNWGKIRSLDEYDYKIDWKRTFMKGNHILIKWMGVLNQWKARPVIEDQQQWYNKWVSVETDKGITLTIISVNNHEYFNVKRL